MPVAYKERKPACFQASFLFQTKTNLKTNGLISTSQLLRQGDYI